MCFNQFGICAETVMIDGQVIIIYGKDNDKLLITIMIDGKEQDRLQWLLYI